MMPTGPRPLSCFSATAGQLARTGCQGESVIAVRTRPVRLERCWL